MKKFKNIFKNIKNGLVYKLITIIQYIQFLTYKNNYKIY